MSGTMTANKIVWSCMVHRLVGRGRRFKDKPIARYQVFAEAFATAPGPSMDAQCMSDKSISFIPIVGWTREIQYPGRYVGSMSQFDSCVMRFERHSFVFRYRSTFPYHGIDASAPQSFSPHSRKIRPTHPHTDDPRSNAEVQGCIWVPRDDARYDRSTLPCNRQEVTFRPQKLKIGHQLGCEDDSTRVSSDQFFTERRVSNVKMHAEHLYELN